MPEHPETDIQEALSSARAGGNVSGGDDHAGAIDAEARMPANGLNARVYAGKALKIWQKCGRMAERHPWWTATSLAAATGCGWLCVYFGWTVLAALVAVAASSKE